MAWGTRKDACILSRRLQLRLVKVILAAEEERFLGSEPVD